MLRSQGRDKSIPATLGVLGRSSWAGSASPNVHICSLSAEEQLPPGFPSIDMGPQLKVVEKARTATMLCAAGGNPDPEISWFKDFLPVDPATSNGRIKQLRSGEQRARVKGPCRLQERHQAGTQRSLPSWAWVPGSHGRPQPGADPPGLSRGCPVGGPDPAIGPPGQPRKKAWQRGLVNCDSCTFPGLSDSRLQSSSAP